MKATKAEIESFKQQIVEVIDCTDKDKTAMMFLDAVLLFDECNSLNEIINKIKQKYNEDNRFNDR